MAAARPDLVLLGHVTRDEVCGASGDVDVRLGGAVTFGALTAARLGLRCALVTAAPPASPLLEPLRAEPLCELHVVPSEAMTTFRLDHTGERRRLSLRARAVPLLGAHIPAEARRAPLAFLGPVAGELGRDALEAVRGTFSIAGLQGWLRATASDGAVFPAAAEPPFEAAGLTGLGAAVLSEEDHPAADALARRLATCGPVVAVTRGARGATLYGRFGAIDVPAAPAREVDATGAGDVFALVWGMCLAAGAEPAPAAALAAEAAARSVEGAAASGLAGIDRGRLAPWADGLRGAKTPP